MFEELSRWASGIKILTSCSDKTLHHTPNIKQAAAVIFLSLLNEYLLRKTFLQTEFIHYQFLHMADIMLNKTIWTNALIEFLSAKHADCSIFRWQYHLQNILTDPDLETHHGWRKLWNYSLDQCLCQRLGQEHKAWVLTIDYWSRCIMSGFYWNGYETMHSLIAIILSFRYNTVEDMTCCVYSWQ